MSTPPQGIKVLDFIGVQSGPSYTQMLAWFGADATKIERPGVGDVTRHQLRGIPDINAPYFTMLSSNKHSIGLDTKTAEGKEVMEKLTREADILVENFHPGATDHMGFTWEYIQEIDPHLISGSIKGFDECSLYVNVRAYENVTQTAGGAASTTGSQDGPPLVGAATLGNSSTGMHLLIGLPAALLHREKTGRGQRVTMSVQDAVLNLCRVKLRNQQRLDKLGCLEEYPQYPNGAFGDAVPHGGNASGGSQLSWILECKDWETNSNVCTYFTIQEQNWENICKAIGKLEWTTDPVYSTAHTRQPRIFDIFAKIKKYTVTIDKHEMMVYLTQFDIPCAPVLGMKEILLDLSLHQNGSVVGVEQPLRGEYPTAGCPMKFSVFTSDIETAPLLGEYTAAVLQELGYSDDEIAAMKQNHAIWY